MWTVHVASRRKEAENDLDYKPHDLSLKWYRIKEGLIDALTWNDFVLGVFQEGKAEHH